MEDQSRLMCTSNLLDFNDSHGTAGLGELQPQPEFYWVSHVCVGL
jgi:hypothetical protein